MNNSNLTVSTVSGTLISIALTVSWENVLETAILAAVGASVSCAVSLIWKSRSRKDRDPPE